MTMSARSRRGASISARHGSVDDSPLPAPADGGGGLLVAVEQRLLVGLEEERFGSGPSRSRSSTTCWSLRSPAAAPSETIAARSTPAPSWMKSSPSGDHPRRQVSTQK